jgi:hypothetical protein
MPAFFVRLFCRLSICLFAFLIRLFVRLLVRLPAYLFKSDSEDSRRANWVHDPPMTAHILRAEPLLDEPVEKRTGS